MSSLTMLRDEYVDKQVGECFEFGRYPQGANGEIAPITWRVLEREADYLLVIAVRGWERKWYKGYYERGCDVIWAYSNIRRWLNSPFMSVAFNEQERKCILKTSIVNNEGPNTEDFIFLLSVDEAKSLFAKYTLRRAKPTRFAFDNDAHTDNGYCCWWLRSRGSYGNYAACVETDGSVYDRGNCVNDDYRAVRPALKLAL